MPASPPEVLFQVRAQEEEVEEEEEGAGGKKCWPWEGGSQGKIEAE